MLRIDPKPPVALVVIVAFVLDVGYRRFIRRRVREWAIEGRR